MAPRSRPAACFLRRMLPLLAALAAARPRHAAATGASPALSHALVAKAQVDECFAGFGRDAQPFADAAARRCPYGTTPRISGSYVFSMTQGGSPNAIWFGTRRVRLLRGSARARPLASRQRQL
jgi:hypothetical protein